MYVQKGAHLENPLHFYPILPTEIFFCFSDEEPPERSLIPTTSYSRNGNEEAQSSVVSETAEGSDPLLPPLANAMSFEVSIRKIHAHVL